MKDLEKLPKWAQTEIAELKGKINRLEEMVKKDRDRIAQMTGEKDTSVKYASGYRESPNDYMGLPEDSRIRFKIGDRYSAYIDCYIKKRGSKTCVEVHGGECLVVSPQVSNVILVELGD